MSIFPRRAIVLGGNLLLIASVLVGTTACEKSVLADDDEVVLTGVLQSADGAALAESEVLLIRHPDVGEVLTGAVTLVGTLGTACLFHPESVELCDSVQKATTDADGMYRFDLLGADTKGTLDNAVSYSIAAASGDDEATALSVEATFVIQTTELVIPDLRLWDAAVSATPDGDDTALAFASIDDITAGELSSYQLELRTDEGRSWQSVGLTEPAALWTAEDVEDFAGRVHAAAYSDGRAENTDIRYEHRAPGPLLSGDLVPESRGADCTVALDGASAALEGDGSCPLTDGSLAGYAAQGPSCTPEGEEDTCDQTSDTWIAVDLGQTRTISHIYLRQLSLDAAAALETSLDGETFLQVAELSSGSNQIVRVDLPVAAPVLVVRLRTLDERVKLEALGELSVF